MLSAMLAAALAGVACASPASNVSSVMVFKPGEAKTRRRFENDDFALILYLK